MEYNSALVPSNLLPVNTYTRWIQVTIDNLPNDATKASTRGVMAGLSEQVYGQASRLDLLIKTIFDKLMLDKHWALTAVFLYHHLSNIMEYNFFDRSYVDGKGKILTGSKVVLRTLMHYSEVTLKSLVVSNSWYICPGFLPFLAELWRSDLQPAAMLQKMLEETIDMLNSSDSLFAGDNFDIFIEFIVLVGPKLDEGAMEPSDFTACINRLRKHGMTAPLTIAVTIGGLLRLREHGWDREASLGPH
ncbi:hypothetical protein K505DRAFT_335273 [Melanomma pulvis-pyrius CBS 109.77]|uniref:Uncharacterized protein n=1 Tax=Melanomma pulvis-pyrius CBS 109.77 TaxID=1314802 RepID=A0A6A6XIX4_9PLEO|nr:hypothetical protein K505DRAFT_335273 [Melanomma pulvis-pyrius CBS 109.77]